MKIKRSVLISILLFVPAFILLADTGTPETGEEGHIIFYSGEFNKRSAERGQEHVFRPGEELSARVILGEPLSDIYEKMDWRYDYELEKFHYNYAIDFYIDGEKRIQWMDELPADLFKEWSYYDFVIVPTQEEKLKYSLYVSDWVAILKGLPAGKHNVRMEFRAANTENPPSDTDPLATGEFIIKTDESSVKEFMDAYRILLPEATLYSEEISRDLIRAAEGAFDDLVPIAAVIVEPTGEWQYTRDETGMVQRRYITAAIALSGIEDECFVRTALFSQEMIEPELYRDLKFVKELEDFYHYAIPCENVFIKREN